MLLIHISTIDRYMAPIGTRWIVGAQSASSRILLLGFPGGPVVENLPANAGDTGSSPGLGGSHMPRSG